jgi:hypothetical protein
MPGGTVIEPKIVTMPLPHGRDWLWYADLNLVALAPHLDDAGRERALDELQAEWRASIRRRLAAVPSHPGTRPPPNAVMVPVWDLPVSAV